MIFNNLGLFHDFQGLENWDLKFYKFPGSISNLTSVLTVQDVENEKMLSTVKV